MKKVLSILMVAFAMNVMVACSEKDNKANVEPTNQETSIMDDISNTKWKNVTSFNYNYMGDTLVAVKTTTLEFETSNMGCQVEHYDYAHTSPYEFVSPFQYTYSQGEGTIKIMENDEPVSIRQFSYNESDLSLATHFRGLNGEDIVTVYEKQ